MDTCYYYGEISDEGKTVWDNNEISPFDILSKNKHIEFRGGWVDFLGWARRCLHDEVQVDWGSFAWKGCGRDLQMLKENHPDCTIESFDDIEQEKEYGVVFIEMS